MRRLFSGLVALVLVAGWPGLSSGQYFGKNKVQYDTFNWKLIETAHFHIYYYDAESEAAMDAARMAERSYSRLAHVLGHEVERPIPVIFYASHSQFQETNVLPELIDEGTGGVTEFLKRRVLLPFSGSYSELEHVLAHELVHAFQIDILFGGSSSAFANPFAFSPPGWFMEGMAEYLSLGGVDPNTEMWLRDAALQGYLLSVEQLEQVGDIRIYRFGQSFWEYVARRFGEDKVGAILRRAGQARSATRAVEYVTGMKMEKLSEDWLEDIRVTYLPQIARHRKVDDFGRPLTRHDKDGSNFNVIPALSPSGDKVAYISDRSTTTGLYLASAIDGKILSRLVKGEKAGAYESFRFFTSATDWSPDGTRVAFPAKSGENDALYIVDVRSHRRVAALRFKGIDAITSPTWSPDGAQLAFSGYVGGMSDLFVVDADGKNLRRLTADRYSDKDPKWSPDGKYLVFSTDRGPETDLDRMVAGPPRISLYDMSTANIRELPGMAGRNISPCWSPDSRQVLFVSDRTGIPNLFVEDIETGQVRQVSDLLTGVSGITDGSPPVGLSRDGKRLVFSAFSKGGWDLFAVKEPFNLPALKPAPPADSVLAVVAPDTTGGAPAFPVAHPVRGEPGGLERVALTITASPVTPPVQADSTEDLGAVLPGESDRWPDSRGRPQPRHDRPVLRYLSRKDSVGTASYDSLKTALTELPDSTGFRRTPYRTHFSTDYASTGAAFGSNTGLTGQAVLAFSDVLGNKNIVVAAGIYGSLLDSDMLFQYTNLGHRANFGVSLFQFRNDYYLRTVATQDEFEALIYRGAEFLVSRPFDKFRRLELSLGGVAISNKVFLANYYYSNQEQVVSKNPAHFYLDPSVALVKDTALYGSTGPLDGTRARLSVEQAIGGLTFTNTTLDYRRYLNMGRRYALAVRMLGASSAGRDPQIFSVGGPFTIRSVDYGDLIGTHVALANLEFRFPFIDRLSTSFPLPLDFPSLRGVVFFDAGGTWGYDRNLVNRRFRPFTSQGGFRLNDMTAAYGLGLRMGLGFLVLRYDVAQPTNLVDNLGHARHFFSLGADF